MRRAIVFALIAFAAAAPAQAHWQYTRWGMSPEEVLAARPGLTAGIDRENSVPGSLVRVSGAHREDDRDFIVRFGFDGANRLIAIDVEPKNLRDCRRTIEGVERRLGPGERDTYIPDLLDLRTWQDRDQGNMVRLILIGRMSRPGSCSIRYHPPEGPGDPEELAPEGKPGSGATEI
jgi:hypothetical protein